MTAALVERMAPDDLWALFQRVVPPTPVRPQGGGHRRRGDREVLADTITAHLRRWLASRGIPHRLARKGIESSGHLGRYRWVVERTVSWLSGCRRLHRRYERKPEHFLAFTAIAATLICHRRLTK
ncbi:hypothetical protein CFC35_35920 [Streptomyces sp. FBKL.4005]|uniref:transposase n=1 Tax=Streptomyces sp. FBKL.4005 TaxID=2015515 RepID=UPI000B96172B|nr:hypothetical protein CFC35_35920 [Streptomyces sp. FBKL.4005]